MTRQRYDEHSTEFGLWLRDSKDIDSSNGFITTNIDYMWTNYKSNKWMYIEEKRYNSQLRFPQSKLFEVIDKSAKSDVNYYGFHFLLFSKTNPTDGDITLDNKIITAQDLIEFLQFKKIDEWYISYFDKLKNSEVKYVNKHTA